MPNKRSGGRRRPSPKRHYPRTARLKQLFLEILAQELARIDDPRLELVSFVDVEVDPDLNWSVVYFSGPADIDDDNFDAENAVIREALDENRIRLQGAIAAEARIRRTPELQFKADEVAAGAARIENILRSLPELQANDDDDDPQSASDAESLNDVTQDGTARAPGGDVDGQGN